MNAKTPTTQYKGQRPSECYLQHNIKVSGPRNVTYNTIYRSVALEMLPTTQYKGQWPSECYLQHNIKVSGPRNVTYNTI
jgi:hypothetical protein